MLVMSKRFASCFMRGADPTVRSTYLDMTPYELGDVLRP